jgi:hypothetical protein
MCCSRSEWNDSTGFVVGTVGAFTETEPVASLAQKPQAAGHSSGLGAWIRARGNLCQRTEGAQFQRRYAALAGRGLPGGETRYSPLNQIDISNVGKLGLSWSYELGAGGARITLSHVY